MLYVSRIQKRWLGCRACKAALPAQDRCAPQSSAAQILERVVGILEWITHDRRLEPALGSDGKELARVGAGQVRDRDNLALLPKDHVGEARNVRHVDAAANH